MAFRDELDVAIAWLGPVLSKTANRETARGLTIIDMLVGDSVDTFAYDATNFQYQARTAVIRKALGHIKDIHYLLARSSDDIPDNLRDQQTIGALLDLISIEGIYPYLLPGVGVPIQKRIKSLLNCTTTRATQAVPDQAESIAHLTLVLDELQPVYEIQEKTSPDDLTRGSQSLYSELQKRILADLIAASAQLMYQDKQHVQKHVMTLDVLENR